MSIDKSEPIVSAIVVTHNRKDLVVGAINSVLDQTYPNIELFVVDDASAEETKFFLENLSAEKGFNYIYIPSSESKGGNYARNLGIKSSSGEYVAFLDDDDEWLPDKISEQVSYMQSHKECGVVACFNIVEFNFKDQFPENRDGMLEGDVHEKIFTKIPFVTSVSMYRRSVLDEVGLFDESLRYWQETELNYRVAQVSQFGCVHKELSLYRVVDKDKNRLTNQLDGWINAVKYIENKHSLLIKELKRTDYKKHKLLIANDGLNRAKRINNQKWIRRFHFMIFQYQPNIRDLILSIIPESFVDYIYSIRRHGDNS